MAGKANATPVNTPTDASPNRDLPVGFLRDVLAGLSESQPSLPSKYFYDDAGSELFEKICDLPEYYPTRTEIEIMRAHAAEMAECIGEDVCIVELGSGSSTKTPLLLSEFDPLLTYVPVDISGEFLESSAHSIADQFPQFDVQPIAADFTQSFELPESANEHDRICVYFPGSTIGNFTSVDAIALLSQMSTFCKKALSVNPASGNEAGLLVGIDLHKSSDVLEAAYDDSAGVTAAFNKNLLVRINRELGGDFDVGQFDHLAIYDEQERRIEMRLVSRIEQTVRVGEQEFHFQRGQYIRTEYSHKYTTDGFGELACKAGWTLRQVWQDRQSKFAVVYCTLGDSPTSPSGKHDHSRNAS